MATFKAENIESDDEIDDEIDNTKEIQIEEALKIYQTALKYQSEGPHSLKAAGEAYEELFRSEIFSYPEAQSEYNRDDSQDDRIYSTIQPVEVDIKPIGAEDAPSTLPQALYLSYKNRGQYYIDRLQALLNENEQLPESEAKSPEEIRGAIVTECTKALSDFCEALDKDETDLDLWRRAARISTILGSHRISRYCLETILDGDEDGPDALLGSSSMEATLAKQEYKELLSKLEDDVSLKNLKSSLDSDFSLPQRWKDRLSLYQFLPAPATQPKTMFDILQTPLPAIDVEVHGRSWEAIGRALINRYIAEHTAGQPRLSHRIRISVVGDSPAIPAKQEKKKSPENEAAVEESSQSEQAKLEGDPDSTKPSNREANQRSETEGSSTKTSSAQARKRSSDAADLPENTDAGRLRSKRIRARESLLEESSHAETGVFDNAQGLSAQVQNNIDADNSFFEALEQVSKSVGSSDFVSVQDLRTVLNGNTIEDSENKPTSNGLDLALRDFLRSMQKWNSAKSKTFLDNKDLDETQVDTTNLGFMSLLEDHKPATDVKGAINPLPDLDEFVALVNGENFNTITVCVLWILNLLGSECSVETRSGETVARSSYLAAEWPPELKTQVHRAILSIDEHLRLCFFDTTVLKERVKLAGGEPDETTYLLRMASVAQTLYELHFEAYTQLIHPSTTAEEDTTNEGRRVMTHWQNVANEYLAFLGGIVDSDQSVGLLELRHKWFYIFTLQTELDNRREMTIDLLKALITETEPTVLLLPNNTRLPELSKAAAEREISMLETRDFFVNVFEGRLNAPVDLIESLEPVLEKSLHEKLEPDEEKGEVEKTNDYLNVSSLLSRFVRSSKLALRLALWRKLGDAYSAINYPSKVFSVQLRSMELLVQELKSASYADLPEDARENLLLRVLRSLRRVLSDIVSFCVKRDSQHDIFEIIDEAHLRASAKAALDVFSLLYTVSFFDDSTQTSQKSGPLTNPFKSYPVSAFHNPSVKLHDMQVQTALLIYRILEESAVQFQEAFPDINAVKLEFLRRTHHNFGARRTCKASDSLFLQFYRDELLGLSELGQKEAKDLAQVVYDLYDLPCFHSQAEREDHGCDADYLDRNTAVSLIDFVLKRASTINVKDILKSDISKAIEKIHSTIDKIKSNSTAASRNKEFCEEYLRSPIRPLELIKSLDGLVSISALKLKPDEAPIASKGWYYLKGQMALTKHKAQRLKVQGSVDDLKSAMEFFLRHLEFDPEHWECWYHLGRTYDAFVEEQVLWSAEKLNSNMTELNLYERKALHAYALACSYAFWNPAPEPHRAELVADLYADFTYRIYSSTCDPFLSRAFSIEQAIPRFRNLPETPGLVHRTRPYRNITNQCAWKVCATLLDKAIHIKSDVWHNYYMLAKCMWKMYSRTDPEASSNLSHSPIIDNLLEAVARLPERKERNEPTLEPIYKTIIVVHKLVRRSVIDVERGVEIFEECMNKQHQFDSKLPELDQQLDTEGFVRWDSYVVEVLKMLRKTDKARWHHRIVARIARIIFGRSDGTLKDRAQTAKDYLLEQNLYNAKTLSLTVWKPVNERPGRHWVYISRYAQLLSRLFEATKDIDGMQSLVRRIRRKGNEFFPHAAVWNDVCEKDIRLHRQYAGIPENQAKATFKALDQEEFGRRALEIDRWAHSADAADPLLVAFKEGQELRKLNHNIQKSLLVDEFLLDVYAVVWAKVFHDLGLRPGQKTPAEPPPSSTPTAGANGVPGSTPEKPRNIMSLDSLMNIEGLAEDKSSIVSRASSVQPDQPARTRSRIVLLREVLKRAYETTTEPPKALSPAVAPAPGSPSPVLPVPAVRVVVDLAASKPATNDDGEDDARMADADADADAEAEAEAEHEAEHEGDEDSKPDDAEDDGRDAAAALGTATAENSYPGSVHDSADNESELSELEDDAEPPPPSHLRQMFARVKGGFVSAGGSGAPVAGTETPDEEVGTPKDDAGDGEEHAEKMED